MATLREIKRRITGVKSTAKITSAMKMVSAAKLRRAQEAAESSRPYVQKLEETLSNLVSTVGDGYTHSLIEKRKEVKNIAIIVVSSDRGLCGSFNTNLFKSIKQFIDNDLKAEHPSATINVVPVGRKGVSFYGKDVYKIIDSFPGVFLDLNFDQAKRIISSVLEKFISGEIDKVYVYYNEFKNIIKQIPTPKLVLPLEPKAKVESSFNVDYIFEPSKAEILDALLPKFVDILMWKSLLESNAAEYAAKMMAMDNATRNARDLITSLDLIYNRERQAAITKEMLEIVGGAEALSK